MVIFTVFLYIFLSTVQIYKNLTEHREGKIPWKERENVENSLCIYMPGCIWAS